MSENIEFSDLIKRSVLCCRLIWNFFAAKKRIRPSSLFRKKNKQKKRWIQKTKKIFLVSWIDLGQCNIRRNIHIALFRKFGLGASYKLYRVPCDHISTLAYNQCSKNWALIIFLSSSLTFSRSHTLFRSFSLSHLAYFLLVFSII